MLASNYPCSAIVSFKPNIIDKKVVFNKNSCTTSLPRVFSSCLTIVHSNLHLNMKCITSPVCHVIHELVLFHHDIRVVTITKVWVLDVNDSSCHSNTFWKSVINKNHGPSISFDYERRYIFYSFNYNGIIKFCVRIYNLLEKVTCRIIIICALLEKKTRLFGIRKVCNHP